MTEFALIAPVFMLIVVGMLVFGRLFFYWIETNHVANETARWAVVDRNPYSAEADAPAAARKKRATEEFEDNAAVCIDYPGKSCATVAARRSRAGPRAGARHLHQVLRLRRDDQGLVDDAPRADRRQRRPDPSRSPIPRQNIGTCT